MMLGLLCFFMGSFLVEFSHGYLRFFCEEVWFFGGLLFYES